MAKTTEITATAPNSITITLPDGLSVKLGEPVPVEVLEMVVAHVRLQQRSVEAGAPEPEGWCIGGCGVQIPVE